MTVCFMVVSIKTLRSHSDPINRRLVLFSVCVKFRNVGFERLSPKIVYQRVISEKELSFDDAIIP